MKKILSLLLAFVMLMSMGVSAAEGFMALDIDKDGAPDTAKMYDKVVFASYDENGKLIGVADKSDISFPQNTKSVKAFVLNGTASEEKPAENVGVGGFENKNENPDDIWVVGLVGASTVQAGQYSSFLYQYYATRYPNKNIVILNKGSAGCTAWDIYKRLNWDIFNEDDPLGYGACDEIAIMVGANDLGYSGYTDGKMPDDQYEVFYNGKNRYVNNPQKVGKLVPNMSVNIEDCFNTYKRIVKWCKENNKRVTFTPMTLYDESDAFESTLSYGVCYGSNHALGVLSEKLKAYAKEEGIPFVDTWGLSNEYTNTIRANYPDVKTVITGTDGLHHSLNGGYLVGYIIANQQEKDEIVASVEIDSQSKAVKTDGATVSNLSASASKISYTYLAESLPLYAKAPGYEFAEGYGVDITNTMNKEIIKVVGLESGTYTLKMDGKKVAEFTADELSKGVNIATFENNPGQIQSKALYDNYYDRRKMQEAELRSIFNEELRLRNVNLSNHSVHYDDERYKTFTPQDWIDLCNQFVAEGFGTLNADTYPEKKLNQDKYVKEVKECIDGMLKDSKPVSLKVTIEKK